jgi:hypothetical protein
MMRTYRFARWAVAAALAVTLAGCSNHSSDTEAPVYLTADMREGIADVDISAPVDVVIPQLLINSRAKSPSESLSGQQDVYLNHWVTTCSRTDGGTVVSPTWHNYLPVFVPAGGTATLQNYRIFPSDYFREMPLSQLFPENGGFDLETGARNIRQRLRVEIFGKTVAGREISLAIDININFFYATP